MSTSNVDTNMSTSPSTQAEGLLPAFSTRQYPHLPTPQSPGNLARYVLDRPHSPESPIPNGNGVVHSASTSSTHHSQRAGHRKMSSDDNTTRIQANLHQYATPESSPQYVLSSPLLTTSATPRHLIPTSTEFTTPKQQSSFSDIKLESPIPISLPTMLPRVSSSSPPPELSGLHSSSLSSPFMAKASTAGRKSNSLLDPLPTEVDDVFSSSNVNSPGRANPALPPQHPTLEPGPTANSGGEIERIRQARREEVLLQIQEAEKRRPEYLKRAKRTLSEADPSYLEEEENTRDRALGVGITESPHKGRRLTLFQETSEESFEESLMAGGYGRYRTADWVRQPQPISLPANPVAGSPIVVSHLEEADEAPPTEKETKKRKRLAAFRSEPNQSSSKLCAVELEGRGRVLIDVPSEEPVAPASPEPTPSKKRGTNRRKKKGENLSIDKNPPGTSKVENHGEKPNWPDSEFPWRLRTEERIELAKAEEEERLRCIERFLDRDSDDEDEDSNVPIQGKTSLSARLEDDSQPDDYQVKMGRGKMVPVRVYPGEMERPNFVSRTSFPSDPSDARAALLSKKSVRTLSYRQQKRQRELGDDEEEEIVCICHGKDDGRELVQCDACQTWYHLECIGIKNIAELGKEEDPWFCRGCVARSPSPPTKANSLQPSEPTFVPTDNEPNVRGSSDTPFFQPSLQDSPSWRLPRTPTRGGSFNTFSDSSHSWSSWADSSSRPGPYTPQHSLAAPRGHDGHIYYEESPFDPTSTPSRGIRFHPSIATPKNTGFPRSAGLFQTPSKSTARGSMHRSFGSTGPPVDDSGGNPSSHDHFARIFPYDESPIRRNRSSESSIPRRKLHSPSRSKTSTSVLEESPIVRSQLQRTAWNDDDDRIS